MVWPGLWLWAVVPEGGRGKNGQAVSVCWPANPSKDCGKVNLSRSLSLLTSLSPSLSHTHTHPPTHTLNRPPTHPSPQPLIYDADTGGQPEIFRFTVRSLEKLGASMAIIEDKAGLKQNSLFGTERKQQLAEIEAGVLDEAAARHKRAKAAP